MPVTVLTEGLHPGHYIVSEANIGATGVSRSIDTITVAVGQVLEAGTVIQDNGAGEAIPFDGTAQAIGVLFDNVNTSATGANAAVPGCVYHARDCEVDANALVVNPALTPAQLNNMDIQLKNRGIVQRA